MALSQDAQEARDAMDGFIIAYDQLRSAVRALIDSIDDNKIDSEHIDKLRECMEMD